MGISLADREKLFQPFIQADGSITRRFGGTGLGLAISQNLLQLMGGEFSVESTQGQGSCFSFELIFQEASTQDMGTLMSNSAFNSKGLLQLSIAGCRVLIVEDNRINQQVVSELLTLQGLHVTLAGNGKEALNQLEQQSFDAVLMDVHMPEMDGFQATEQIRLQPRFTTLPIIALTAGVTQSEREHCLHVGMNDFVAKPINPWQLLATLQHWIKPDEHLLDDKSSVASPPTESPNPLEHLPGFELKPLLILFNYNQERTLEMLSIFMEDIQNLSAEIELKLAENNLPAVFELVHQIKGASGNVGAMDLHKAAIALEDNLDQTQFPNVLHKFQQSLTKTIITIINLQTSATFSATLTIDIQELTQTIIDLDNRLKENDFIPETMLNLLKSQLPSEQIKRFTRLRKQINNFHYDDARRTLHDLLDSIKISNI